MKSAYIYGVRKIQVQKKAPTMRCFDILSTQFRNKRVVNFY